MRPSKTDLQEGGSFKKPLSSECALGLRTFPRLCFCGHTFHPSIPATGLPAAAAGGVGVLAGGGCEGLLPSVIRHGVLLSFSLLTSSSAALGSGMGWLMPNSSSWACCRLRATWKHRAVGHPPAPQSHSVQLCQSHGSPTHPRVRPENPSLLFKATQVTLRCSQSREMVSSQSPWPTVKALLKRPLNK